jgi:hypothetical protein
VESEVKPVELRSGSRYVPRNKRLAIHDERADNKWLGNNSANNKFFTYMRLFILRYRISVSAAFNINKFSAYYYPSLVERFAHIFARANTN